MDLTCRRRHRVIVSATTGTARPGSDRAAGSVGAMRCRLVVPTLLLLAAGTACTGQSSAPPVVDGSRGSDLTGSPAPGAAATPSEGSADVATPVATPTAGPDEVVVGCSTSDAEELGEVVVGADLDGDGAKDVVRYVATTEGPCARTVLGYLPDGIVGFSVPGAAEVDTSTFAAVQPDDVAYVAFRETAPRGGFQQHLLALDGDVLGEVRTEEGPGEPLLPFVATDSAGTRAGFLCAGSSLVGQVSVPAAAGGDADVTTTTYAVAGDTASVEDSVTTSGVAPDALLRQFPALDPDVSVVPLCTG